MAKNVTIKKSFTSSNIEGVDNIPTVIAGSSNSVTTGGVSGSGTIGKLPKFTSASALGDSLFSDDGTTPKYNGYKIWTENNDGSGSGLDADTLRGLVPQTSVTDATANRLMRVGAFGLGGNSVPLNSINVDTISENLNGYCASCTNTPLGANGFIVHNQINSSYATQIFIVPTDPINILGRNKTAGVWSSWVTIYHSGNSNLSTVDWTANNLTFNTALKGNTAFVDGYAGSGIKLWKDGSNKYSLTLDNLTIRGAMNVYELLVNKIRATNGSLFVTDSGKIKSVNIENNGNDYYHIYLEDTITFQSGDIVKCQVFTGSGIKSYILQINYANTTNNSFTVYLNSQVLQGGTGVNVPAVGDTIVRIGSNNNDNRKGNIYLTNSDTNAPYIQITDGVTSSNLAGNVKLRIGKLDGITSTVFGSLTGYGSYTYNGYYEGNINATGGKIGGFTINANDLSNNYLAVNSATNSFDLYITDVNGSSGIRLYHGAKDSSPSYLGRIYAGKSAQYGDTVSILSSNAITLSSVNTIVTGGLTVNGTATTINNLSATNITANQLELTGNIYSESNLTVDGISTIVRPTTTLTISYSGIYAGYSSYAVNGRREGKTNFLTINGVTTSSSKSWQKLAQITNYISPGYTVYFTSVFYTIGVDVYENMPGYIDTSGNIYMQPVVNKNFAANVTWITA